MSNERISMILFTDAVCFAIVNHCANGNSNAAKRLAMLFVASCPVDVSVAKCLDDGDYSRAYDVASWCRVNYAEGK